jgi:allophanate hydrolase subunit 2
LWGCAWRITPQSDRYGFRLAGDELRPKAPLELRSHGIVPGVIQVPHGGQPIIQMRDAQPSGGYPKIGVVIEADLWRLGQAPIGSRIRFLPCTWDEALDAGAGNRRWLEKARRTVALLADRRTR